MIAKRPPRHYYITALLLPSVFLGDVTLMHSLTFRL